MASQGIKRGAARPAEKKSTIPAPVKNSSQKPAPFSAVNADKSVEQRAYEIYLKRVSMGSPGDEIGDWLQAESELRADQE